MHVKKERLFLYHLRRIVRIWWINWSDSLCTTLRGRQLWSRLSVRSINRNRRQWIVFRLLYKAWIFCLWRRGRLTRQHILIVNAWFIIGSVRRKMRRELVRNGVPSVIRTWHHFLNAINGDLGGLWMVSFVIVVAEGLWRREESGVSSTALLHSNGDGSTTKTRDIRIGVAALTIHIWTARVVPILSPIHRTLVVAREWRALKERGILGDVKIWLGVGRVIGDLIVLCLVGGRRPSIVMYTLRRHLAEIRQREGNGIAHDGVRVSLTISSRGEDGSRMGLRWNVAAMERNRECLHVIDQVVQLSSTIVTQVVLLILTDRGDRGKHRGLVWAGDRVVCRLKTIILRSCRRAAVGSSREEVGLHRTEGLSIRSAVLLRSDISIRKVMQGTGASDPAVPRHRAPSTLVLIHGVRLRRGHHRLGAGGLGSEREVWLVNRAKHVLVIHRACVNR